MSSDCLNTNTQNHAVTCFNQQAHSGKAPASILCNIRGPSIPQPSAMMSIKEGGKGRQEAEKKQVEKK